MVVKDQVRELAAPLPCVNGAIAELDKEVAEREATGKVLSSLTLLL